MKINSLFLLNSKTKPTILSNLQVGFTSEWDTAMPPPNSYVENYFKNQEAVQKCRDRFTKEIKLGRMIGGIG